MNLIAAADKNWAIGRKGKLLVTIPADQALFRQETLGKVIVMGRKTLATLPGGQPLNGRVNVVLSRNPETKVRGARVFHDMKSVLAFLSDYPSGDIYIIGGAEIYREFLPYCDTAHITRIDYAYDADAYFPDLDSDPDWEITADSEEQTFFSLCYEFVRYERKKS